MTASSTAEFTLVEPAHKAVPPYVRTAGPEVAELCELAGLVPDPEQRLGLDILFGVDELGRSAAFEFAVICARQNLKTGLLKMAGLGWLFLTAERLIVWSAHEFSTTREAHRDMVELIESSSWLSRRVAKVYDSSNDKSIHLTDGRRMIFKARTQSGGRGLSGGKVILDEAFALMAAHMGALVPLMTAQPDPQLVYASSAGMAKSAVLRGVRDRGRSNDPGRLGYLEWCAPPGGCLIDGCEHSVTTPGCALDKVENLQAANPLLGRRRANGTGLTMDYLRNERNTLNSMPMEFARERLGWWDDPGAAEVFGVGKWEACSAPETPTGVRLVVVAVAVSATLSSAAVVGAGYVGARLYVQVLAHGPGWDWLPEQVPAGVKCVVDPRGPSAVAVAELRAAKVKLVETGSGDLYEAYDAFYSLVVDGELMHDQDEVLTTSANGAVPRKVGDRTTWGRRTSTSDTTPIEAATLAAWWASRPAPPPPPPPPTPVTAAPPTTASRDNVMGMGF